LKVRSSGHGATFLLTIGTPGAGKIVIAGIGVTRVTRLVGRAGTYNVRVGLTRRERTRLRRGHTLIVRLGIVFAPTDGGPRAAARISVRVGR
jgi:hypothetical protein